VTSQSKTYIELRDIIAIRFECKKCQASISMPVSINMNFAHACPNCGAAWTSVMQASIQKELKSCVDAIAGMALSLKNWEQVMAAGGSKGFTLSLEISEEAAPAASGKD
jgi:uncharacterized paraquat-inducible protein A